MKFWSVIFISIIVLSGCRISRAGSERPSKDGTYVGSSADASNSPTFESSGAIMNLKVHVDMAGRVMETIALRLDYFPPSRPDAASIPTCQSALPDDSIVGRLICDAPDTAVSMDVKALHIAQLCYTAVMAKKIDAKQNLVLTGCNGTATLRSLLRSPSLRLEILR